MRRHAVPVSPAALVKVVPLGVARPLPLLMQPAVQGVSLVDWASHNRALIEDHLLRHGAILFRDFAIHGVEAFERCIEVISGGALEYRFRASPRTRVSGNIYTSTDYPADQTIFPHNEHAYSPVFPLRLYFFCDTPAQEGGETPIGDTRQVFRSIDPEIRTRFIQKRIMYVRNFGDGFGLPWQTVFQTTDKAEVEAYCRSVGIELQWKPGDRLRTSQIGPAIVRHPRTGEPVWFNHATFFHVTTLELATRDALLAEFEEHDLPQNTYYGDGSAIEPDTLEHLRAAYQQALIEFPWRRGDLLLLDNMLAFHGRRPYRGARKVLTGMAEAFRSRDLDVSSTQTPPC